MPFTVSRQDNGKPLLQLLRTHLDLSGRAAKALLDQRQVFVNGQRIWMAKHTCRTGDEIQVPPGSGSKDPGLAETIPTLYQDKELLAVDKPPGVITDQAPDSLEQRLRTQHKLPGLRALHRLDRDTSGVVLFTTPGTDREPFVDLFRNREIDKHYDLILRGTLPQSELTVRSHLDGREAESRFTLIARHRAYSIARCQLVTGRTHQIRKHLRQLNCTLAGDKGYNTRERTPAVEQKLSRQMLHARQLAFCHPTSGKNLVIKAPRPKDFNQALRLLGLTA